MNHLIPFNRPSAVGQELSYVADAVRRSHLAGDGHYTRMCTAILEEMVGVPKALLTTSCTHALEMAALLLDIRAGDEVIVPSFTFVSTVNAFVLRGAVPRFVDVHASTLNLNEEALESLVTPRTRVIVPVHYAGVGCAMDRILDIAVRHGCAVVEDNAHGLFGRYKGKNLGTFGSLATQSFHETKNIVCGEGGALLVNDANLFERAEIIREKGTNRSKFFRGQIDKYTWVDVGSSYLPSEILAAFLYGQLEASEKIQAQRKNIWDFYQSRLNGWAEERGVRLPVIPPECEQPYHMYYILMPSVGNRQALIGHLKTRGIASAFHYLPLHLSDMGQKFGGKPGDCPVAEDVSGRLLRLPFFFELTEADQERVVTALMDFHFV